MPVRRNGAVVDYMLGDPSRLYDTIIDVIDPSIPRLLASTRLDAIVTA